MYQKSITNIIINRIKFRCIPFKTGFKARCPPSLLLFHRVLEVVANDIGEKRIKKCKFKKEREKIFIIKD